MVSPEDSTTIVPRQVGRCMLAIKSDLLMLSESVFRERFHRRWPNASQTLVEWCAKVLGSDEADHGALARCVNARWFSARWRRHFGLPRTAAQQAERGVVERAAAAGCQAAQVLGELSIDFQIQVVHVILPTSDLVIRSRPPQPTIPAACRRRSRPSQSTCDVGSLP